MRRSFGLSVNGSERSMALTFDFGIRERRRKIARQLPLSLWESRSLSSGEGF